MKAFDSIEVYDGIFPIPVFKIIEDKNTEAFFLDCIVSANDEFKGYYGAFFKDLDFISHPDIPLDDTKELHFLNHMDV